MQGSILLSHGEFSGDIGVTQLPTATGTGGTFPAGTGPLSALSLNDGRLDRSACGAGYSFSGKGDPHGLSLYTGLDNGQKGLIIDAGNTCAAIVDLAGLTTAPRVAGSPNLADTSQASVKALVKFVKLQ